MLRLTHRLKSWGLGRGGFDQPKQGNEKKISCRVGVAESEMLKEKGKMESWVLDELSSRCLCNHLIKEARVQADMRICSSGRNSDLGVMGIDLRAETLGYVYSQVQPYLQSCCGTLGMGLDTLQVFMRQSGVLGISFFCQKAYLIILTINKLLESPGTENRTVMTYIEKVMSCFHIDY